MTDIENELFDDLYTTVKEAFPEADVTDEYNPEDAKFPVVTVIIRNEGEPPRMIDSSRRMRGVNVFAEINAYASRATGYKSVSKKIIALVCDRMKELGFNMLRKHIKIEPECFYYYCDVHGMLVMQDMVNNGPYSFIKDTALPTVGFKKRSDKTGLSGKRKEIFINNGRSKPLPYRR